MRAPFRLRAVYPHDHPRLTNALLKIGAVEGANGSGDRGGIGGRADDAEKAYKMLRVETRWRHPTTVARFKDGEGERITNRERRLQAAVIERRLPIPFGRQRVAGQHTVLTQLFDKKTRPRRDRVDGLTKVHVKVLRLPGALAPDRRRADARTHGRDSHARTGSEAAADDRVVTRKCHTSAAVLWCAADVAHKLGECRVDREFFRFCRLSGRRFVARQHLPSHNASSRLEQLTTVQ